jgi:hypothetical protein
MIVQQFFMIMVDIKQTKKYIHEPAIESNLFGVGGCEGNVS